MLRRRPNFYFISRGAISARTTARPSFSFFFFFFFCLLIFLPVQHIKITSFNILPKLKSETLSSFVFLASTCLCLLSVSRVVYLVQSAIPGIVPYSCVRKIKTPPRCSFILLLKRFVVSDSKYYSFARRDPKNFPFVVMNFFFQS